MNGKDLSPEQKIEYDSRERELVRLNERSNEVDEALSKTKADKVEKEAKQLKEEIKDLDEKIKNAKEINASRESKMDLIRSTKGYKYDIFRINFPGVGELRLSDSQISGLLLQFNVYFSTLDNPFKDSLTDNDKKELLAGIRGENVGNIANKDIADNVTSDNDKKDSDWQIKEPQSKIKEPAYQTFEWYRRWWNFFKHYPSEEMNVAEKGDLDKYPILVQFTQKATKTGPKRKKFPFYDIVKFNEEKGKIDNNRLKALLIDKDTRTGDVKVPRLQSEDYEEGLISYLPGIGKDPEIEYNDSWSVSLATFMIDEVFRYDLINRNPILTQGKNYTLGPKLWAEETPWHSISTTTYTLQSGKDANNGSYKDHDINVDGHRFNNIQKGFKGGLDILHTIFNIKQIRDYFLAKEKRITLASGGVGPNDKNGVPVDPKAPIVFDIKKGEIPEFIDAEDLKKQRKEKRDELLKLDVGYYTAEEKTLLAEKKIIAARIKKLTEANKKLTGDSEKRLLGVVKRLSKNVNDFLSASPVSKRSWTWYEEYKENIVKLRNEVADRLKEENGWKDDDEKYTKFDLMDVKIDAYFKNSNDEVKKELGDIRNAWKKYDEMVQKIIGPRSALYTAFTKHKITNEKDLDEWLKNMDSTKDKIAKGVLANLEKVNEYLTLEPYELTAREKIKNIKLAGMNLENTLREVLGKSYKSTILAAWQKAGYGEGNKFYELITYKNDLREDSLFKTWMKSNNEGGPNLDNDNLAEWIAEKSLGDIKYDLLGYILRYRLIQYIKASVDDRKEFKKETVLGWISEAESCGQQIDNFSDITGGDNRKGDVVLNNFIRNLAKNKGTIMGLDSKNDAEYQIIKRWIDYKEETIKSLKDGMDEEFMKDKDPKQVWNKEPKDLHKEVRNYQITKEGITSENYKDIKDKEKLEKVISYLDDLIDNNLATEEQKTFKQQLSSHMATLQTTTTPPQEKKPEDGKEEKKPEDGKEEKKPDETTKEPDKPKGLPGWAWSLIIIGIVAIVGGLIWYFTSGKKEDEEEGGGVTEPETGEK
ncbi:hypothetical protein [endosymbiont GvMRE of Glomus versiforme]|uniref:hypothetical protein n=1 Tax=endosymbiont GvMRE of Glomus versiforme TaxID=2039283 RepID=UPI000ED1609A|nr:hypothetical protein [endosymbiont GvMRE of Glomus versiforme]RHZ37701.1 hypothetical protein GvMRE_I1g231 [endosymbiont GvMRE of Glomus versiforme]